MTLIGLAAVAAPLAARAQQGRKTYRIAILSLATDPADMTESSTNPIFRALFQELRRLGYVEGQNLVVERRSGLGRSERYPEIAREAVALNPDLIYATGLRLMLPLKAANAAIPVVGITSDPVGYGLAASLSHPGGNMTGVSIDAGIEILGKRMQLLMEAVPKTSKVAYLAPPMGWEGNYGNAMREIASRVGIALVGPPLNSPIDESEYRRVLAAMIQQGVDVLFVADYGENNVNRQLIAELAAARGLPAIHPYRGFVDAGGLMEYAADWADLNRHGATIVDRIFKGEKAGDIPFYQPTKFELRINLKTARALALELPPSLLARADEVIE